MRGMLLWRTQLHSFASVAVADAISSSSAATTATATATTPPTPSTSLLSIDFGSDWLKSCITNHHSSSIGTFLDVVINDQSNRKTPNVLGFDGEGERIIGDSASSLLFRSPARVFPQIKRLLGSAFSSSALVNYTRDYPSLQAVATEERQTVAFKQSFGDVSVEEIVVQLLQMAKRQADTHLKANSEDPNLNEELKDVVLIVPEYWTKEQRTLFSQLTELAGFRTPKAVVNSLTAVAVDYAVRNIPTQKTRLALIGSGAYGVSANLVELEKTVDDVIHVNILKTSSVESLGGLSYDFLLRNELAKKFDSLQKEGTPSITTNVRSMSKLLREARELKEMLSVSTVIEVTMEELFNGKDFKTAVTQEEFQTWTTQLSEQMIQPLREILEGETSETVQGIEFFGGTLRIPSIQAAIRTAFPTIPLGRHVDSEESALFGAAHLAGVLGGVKGLQKVEVDETKVVPTAAAASSSLVLSPTQQASLASKIAILDARATARFLADQAKNTVESLLNDARELLTSKQAKSKKSEAASLEDLIASVSTFIDDATSKTTLEEFTTQRDSLLAAMEPLRVAKKVEPTKPAAPEKPSPPKKKRDRRAEHKKAMEEQAKRDEEKKRKEEKKEKEEKKKKEKKEKEKKEKEEKKKNKADADAKKETKKETKKKGKDEL